MRVVFRPLCLPDDDDLTVDLPAERNGIAVGWGFDTVIYPNTTCDYIKGVPDSKSSPPTKLKKIELE